MEVSSQLTEKGQRDHELIIKALEKVTNKLMHNWLIITGTPSTS